MDPKARHFAEVNCKIIAIVNVCDGFQPFHSLFHISTIELRRSPSYFPRGFVTLSLQLQDNDNDLFNYEMICLMFSPRFSIGELIVVRNAKISKFLRFITT